MLSTVMQTFNQINLASNKPHRYKFQTINFIEINQNPNLNEFVIKVNQNIKY